MEASSARSNVLGTLLPALVGLASGAIVIACWWLLYILDALPFPPFDLGDYFIRRSPGRFATWAIETLGANAQAVALTGGVLTWLAIWAALGVIVGRFAESPLARLTPIVALPAALWLGWWSEGGISAGRMLWLTSAFGGTLAAGGALLAHWLARLLEAQREAGASAASWLEHPGDYQRRELLRQIALVTLAVGAGGTIAGRLVRGTVTAGVTTGQGLPLQEARAALAASVALPTPQPAASLPDGFIVPAGVRQRVTSNDEFYVVDISTRDPNLDERGWGLRVHGLVDRELLIGWPELLSMPSVELDGTLMCISYEHDNGLISTTRWTGVPLRDVLGRAGIRDGAVDVICRGSNGYSDSIPLAKALEPTTLLAYGMNGTTLPQSHGFPCRLYVPGLYGEKNVKWLQAIELVDYDYLGYWQERGWTDSAVITTISIIDTPHGTVQRDSAGVPIGGIAFAGDRGVSVVQVRIDDDEWQDAVLEANDPSLIWQRWRYDWRPGPGRYRLSVRAIDGADNPQIESERPPHPDGMTGLHSVAVDVV